MRNREQLNPSYYRQDIDLLTAGHPARTVAFEECIQLGMTMRAADRTLKVWNIVANLVKRMCVLGA